MNSTWFNVPRGLQDNIVSWGIKTDSATFVEWRRIPEVKNYFSAGGGLLGSPNDYLKFLHCLLRYGEYEGGRILKQETVEMMLLDNLPENIQSCK